MNILLTNDDGYGYKGIELLKKHLAKYGTVYVFAPSNHQSGAGMSFSLNKGFKLTKYNDYEYSLDGTPVDVTLIGLQYLKDVKFDVVVSGCNNGLNISYDTLYSGTVGASLEALRMGIPSISISCDFDRGLGIDNYKIVDDEVDSVLDYIFDNNLLSKKYSLCVNFPSNKYTKSKGIMITKEHYKEDKFYMWEKDGLLYTDRDENLETSDTDSDVYAIANGYISITPLKFSFYTNSGFNDLISRIKK